MPPMIAGERALRDCLENLVRTPGRSSISIVVLGIGFMALLLLISAKQGLVEKEKELVRDFGASSLSWLGPEIDSFQERHLGRLTKAFPK